MRTRYGIYLILCILVSAIVYRLLKTLIMKIRILLLFLFLFLGMESVLAGPQHGFVMDLNRDTLYGRTIVALQKDGYFVECVDSETGFIKVKRYEESNRLFSPISGKLVEMSMFVRAVTDSQSEISVSIYYTYYYNTHETSYHKEELCDDEEVYESVIADIRKSVAGE